jgi:hypothetical protein
MVLVLLALAEPVDQRRRLEPVRYPQVDVAPLPCRVVTNLHERMHQIDRFKDEFS